MTATLTNVERWDCKCEKCKKRWQSRTKAKPKVCRYCKCEQWEQERIADPLRDRRDDWMKVSADSATREDEAGDYGPGISLLID